MQKAVLRSRCAERLREGTVSQFVDGGRDGVPPEPGSLLLSPLERVACERECHGDERESHNPEVQPGLALVCPGTSTRRPGGGVYAVARQAGEHSDTTAEPVGESQDAQGCDHWGRFSLC